MLDVIAEPVRRRRRGVHNLQASMQPYAVGAGVITTRWGGLGTSQMWVAFAWSSFTIQRPDTSTVTVPAPPTALAAPTLGQVAGGVRGALTLFARIALIKDAHIYAVSAEASLAVGANNRLTITAPAAVAGYDGWAPLVGSVTNQEIMQGNPSLPFGTNYTEPTGHFQTGNVQFDATYWPGALVAWGGNPSVTSFWYLFYDPTAGGINTVRVLPDVAGFNTAADPVMASRQNGDGMLPLNTGNLTVSIGVGGGGGPGNPAGSRLL